ncbi:hypothetical protein ER67_004943 [Salmonella enterica subsp. enterica]|nr:hypothetical protein [Salmonella enterica subsp. enterica]
MDNGIDWFFNFLYVKANRGWRGFILRLIGVNLPDKRTEFTQRLLLTRKISGSVMKK